MTRIDHPGNASIDQLIEEMAPGPILDFHDPDVGIKANLAREKAFDFSLRSWLQRKARAERAINRMRFVKSTLRSRAVELGGPI